jgi:hypothetical protein
MSAPTLIKDLIDIPEKVHRGDFVLRLSEGLARAEETVGSLSALVRAACYRRYARAGAATHYRFVVLHD